MWGEIGAVLGALAPPVGLGVLFLGVLRAMIFSDRRSRAERAREDAELARIEEMHANRSGDSAG